MLQEEVAWFIIELTEDTFPYSHSLDDFQQKEYDLSDKKTIYVKFQVEKIQRGVSDPYQDKFQYF